MKTKDEEKLGVNWYKGVRPSLVRFITSHEELSLEEKQALLNEDRIRRQKELASRLLSSLISVVVSLITTLLYLKLRG